MAVNTPIGMEIREQIRVCTNVPTIACAAPPPGAMFDIPRCEVVHHSGLSTTPMPFLMTTASTQTSGMSATNIVR